MTDSDRLWPEQWAVDAWVKATAIESRMAIACAGRPPGARQEVVVAAIQNLLTTARAATERKRRRRWRGLNDRWRGASVGRAYQSLHAAEIFLVELLPEDEIDALVPRILARDATGLDRDDPRRQEIKQLLEATSTSKRAAVKSALTYLYDVSDQAYVRVRDFRNVLLVSAVLIAALMTGLVLAVDRHPDTVPFCFAPGQTVPTSDAGSTSEQVCPSGRSEPSRADVWLIAGLGLLGGALAAAFSIRKIRGTSLPYDIPISLSLLKVPSGSLTAVAGVLLLGGDFVPGLSELDSQRQILAYALVFGYAQQIATQFLDRQAQDILATVPSKEPEGSGTTPSQGTSSIAVAAAKTVEGPSMQEPERIPVSEESFDIAVAPPSSPPDAEPVELLLAEDGEEADSEPPDTWDVDGHDESDRGADVLVKED